jgi:hypothetical protein
VPLTYFVGSKFKNLQIDGYELSQSLFALIKRLNHLFSASNKGCDSKSVILSVRSDLKKKKHNNPIACPGAHDHSAVPFLRTKLVYANAHPKTRNSIILL